MQVSDPHFLYVDNDGKKHALIGALEYDIARERSKIDHVYSHEAMKKALGDTPVSVANAVAYLHDKYGAGAVCVAEDFPAFLLKKLEAEGLDIEVAGGFIFPERMVKSKDEIEKLHAAQILNECGFARVEEVLAAAEIGTDNKLMWQGVALTSEVLQREMNAVLAQGGALHFSAGPICAGGGQGAVPHEHGHGQLYAHELIVVDSFPQHSNGYYGDLTRTYVKGAASEWQTKVYNTVLGAQKLALGLMKPGADLRKIQVEVVTYFKDAGFATGVSDDGRYYGYIHGIGHHIGLTVHDGAMQRSEAELILEVGHVVTVEPGLYYPKGTHKDGCGGCRIEDFVAITANGCENLTSLPKDRWVIG